MTHERPAPSGELLSAEVVLRGQDTVESEPITSDNLARNRPDPRAAAEARAWFDRHGFTTSDVHGISFSVTGPSSLFEKTFSVDLGRGAGQPALTQLPLPELPDSVADAVDDITFSEPPDFGPTSY